MTGTLSLLNQSIKEGEKVKIPWFDPFSLTGKESVIEYKGKEKILINDRVYHLHRFTENFSGARLNSWLDDEGNVIKEESPAGFVFVKEPEFKARLMELPEDGGTDLLASVAVKVIGSMFDVSDKSTARYKIVMDAETDFDLNSGRQQFVDQILTLTREDLTTLPTGDYQCGNGEDKLLSSPYIQAGALEIIKQRKGPRH